MTLEERTLALQPLGFSPREARFLATVALHSGYCLRRQYMVSAGVCYGKNVCDFLDGLVASKLAARFMIRADRGHLYHLNSRTLYRLLGQEHNRNRRQASAALIARKVMFLDFVLAHSNVEWLATEEDKLALFTVRFDIQPADLPQRVYLAAKTGDESTTRYFPHKLPIAVTGDPPVVNFLYLAADPDRKSFEEFLDDHATLFGRLSSWTVTAVAPPGPSVLPLCERSFAQFLTRPTADLVRRSPDLQWYFATRKTVDSGTLARLSVADLNRFRTLRERFLGQKFETLYREWVANPDHVLGTEPLRSPKSLPSVGQLATEVLPFDYSQFGSLPGIA